MLLCKKMDSAINRSCKSCRERQEDLLECGDGSQVTRQCYEDLTDEENDEASVDKVSTDGEYLVVDAATQSSADDILFCTTTPKNGTSVKSMPNELQNEPPPLIKRKINDSSVKLSSNNFQPIIKKQLFQENFKEPFIRKRTKRKKEEYKPIRTMRDYLNY